MPDYKNGKIYKLCSDVDDYVYIGSTCNHLYKRLYQHKKDSKRRSLMKVYEHLNKLGWENVKIILIEECPCEKRSQLLRRERYWFDQNQVNLNSIYPYRTDEEKKERDAILCKKWRDENKDYFKVYSPIWREKNKEEIAIKRQQYYLDNKKKINDQHREYDKKNKDQIAIRKKQYREDNQEKISIRRKNYYEKTKKIIVKCECGIEFKQYDKSRHNKSKRHINFIINQNNIDS